MEVTDSNGGGCICGAIRYEFNGEPLNTVYCYCTDCQQLTGSDRYFGVWVPSNAFRLTKGSPGRYLVEGMSGNKLPRNFCTACGSTLHADASSYAGIVSIPVPSLDNPSRYAPKMAIFTASAPTWSVIPNNIPSFPGMPDLPVPDGTRTPST